MIIPRPPVAWLVRPDRCGVGKNLPTLVVAPVFPRLRKKSGRPMAPFRARLRVIPRTPPRISGSRQRYHPLTPALSPSNHRPKKPSLRLPSVPSSAISPAASRRPRSVNSATPASPARCPGSMPISRSRSSASASKIPIRTARSSPCAANSSASSMSHRATSRGSKRSSSTL